MKKSICLTLFKLNELAIYNVKYKVLFLILMLFLSFSNKQVYAQENEKVSISGLITDEKKEPLIGVNIIVNGTSTGTITDVNGRYNISASANDILLITYIGFTTQEISINGRAEINIVMEADITGLDEVVVVGYGEVKRVNLLGGVESLDAKEIEDIPATSLSSLLNGRMAGVYAGAGQSSGMPGNPTRVYVRLEEKTFGTAGDAPKDASPLYIIDGFRVGQNEFDVLDPSQIESISVLKDASASVYGSSGANGVILVKTKRGKEGKLRISYSGSYGISDATQQTEMLSAHDHASMLNIQNAGRNDGPISEEELGLLSGYDYNWLDDAWKLSSISRNTINLSGGSEKVNYFIGGSHVYETGNFDNLDVTKYSYRIGLDAEIVDGLKASVTVSVDNNSRKYPYFEGSEGGSTMAGVFASLLNAPKWTPPYIDGYPVLTYGEKASDKNNVLASFNTNSFKQNIAKGNTVGINLKYDLPWVKGLSASLTYNRRESHSYNKDIRLPFNIHQFEKLTNDEGDLYQLLYSNNIYNVEKKNSGKSSQISETYNYGQNYQFNGSLAYDKKIGRHSFSAFINYEQRENSGNNFKSTAHELLVENIETQRGFDRNNNAQTDGAMDEGGELATISRVNYSYADKYLLESAFRYEGKTQFSPSERWGFFPSVSVGWIVSEENFFKSTFPFIDFLKVRYSWGKLGYASVPPFEYIRLYEPNNTTYVFGDGNFGNSMKYIDPDVESTGVSWEKHISNNVGLDLKLFNSKVDVTVDAFYIYQYDMLEAVQASLPKTSGITAMPSQNLGRMEMWGYDMTLGYSGRVGNDFKWYVKGIFNFATNRLLEAHDYDAEYSKPADFRYPIGKSTYSSLGSPEQGYVTNGIIRTREQLDAINAEWNARWGHDYQPLNMGIDYSNPELGMLYFQDIGRPGVGDEPYYVQEPDGYVDSFDQIYIEKVNDSFVAKNLLPTSSRMGFSWKNLSVDMLWTFAWGVGSKMVDKAAIAAASYEKNVPAFRADYWTEDNVNAKYPNPYYASTNALHSSFWMKDVYTVRLNTLNVSYAFPKEISNRWGIPSLRVYFTGSNLWTPVSTFDYKDDAIARFNTYPLLRTFNFGINMSL
ncbi:MAG: SusC/RagA family TonB-linked outer membrane protein [Marinilabiliaceae bacterium]|nr:SusC/RagA family TonB-linked outer membrane protein [Marinilabiliaceae bacterium]